MASACSIWLAGLARSAETLVRMPPSGCWPRPCRDRVQCCLWCDVEAVDMGPSNGCAWLCPVRYALVSCVDCWDADSDYAPCNQSARKAALARSFATSSATGTAVRLLGRAPAGHPDMNAPGVARSHVIYGTAAQHRRCQLHHTGHGHDMQPRPVTCARWSVWVIKIGWIPSLRPWSVPSSSWPQHRPHLRRPQHRPRLRRAGSSWSSWWSWCWCGRRIQSMAQAARRRICRGRHVQKYSSLNVRLWPPRCARTFRAFKAAGAIRAARAFEQSGKGPWAGDGRGSAALARHRWGP